MSAGMEARWDRKKLERAGGALASTDNWDTFKKYVEGLDAACRTAARMGGREASIKGSILGLPTQVPDRAGGGGAVGGLVLWWLRRRRRLP